MINKVVLVGRLTQNPELRKSPGGHSVCRFTIACDRNTNRQEKKADFINCVAWRQAADFLSRYGCKGILVGLAGHIQTRSYTGNNGQTIYTTEVLCEELRLLEYKEERMQRQERSQEEAMRQWHQMGQLENGSENAFANTINEDDFPF